MTKIILLVLVILALLAVAFVMAACELRDRPYLYVLADQYRRGDMSYEVYVSLARAEGYEDSKIAEAIK